MNHCFDKVKTIFKNTPSKVIFGLDRLGVSEVKKAKSIYHLRIIADGSNSLKLTDVDHIVLRQDIAGIFPELKSTSTNYCRAGTFWIKTDATEEILHKISTDWKYYIKIGKESKQVLFYDIENDLPLDFGLDIDELVQGKYDELLENFKTIHGLPGGRSSLVNGQVPLSKEKFNLLLGSYEPNSIPGINDEIGTHDLINDLMALKNRSYQSSGFQIKPGGVQVLNVPDGNVSNWDTFFDDYNKAFLDLAAINPMQVQVTFVSDIRERNLLQYYNRELGVFEAGKPSGLAKEIKYLREHGIKTAKIKDGSNVNLDDVDLSFLNF